MGLPVIGSFFAGCPAVQLRDGNGSHTLCYSNLFLGQHRIILSADTASEVRQLLSQKRR